MLETCLQVLFVIIHACLQGHCFVGVYNTSLVGVFSANQMANISKASCQACTCLFFFFGASLIKVIPLPTNLFLLICP